MLIIFGFLISPIYAAVSDVQITPSNPKVGDTITITGMANPNEDINCQAWFEVNPIVSYPYYGYLMYGVDIPTPPNTFKVIGENVRDISVSVNMGAWITIDATANSNGVATVSKSNVPAGTYDMKIGGKIKNQSKPVKLKIIASTTIKADENGNFKYSYKTNNIPEGTTVYLSIGGVNKEIIIKGDTPAPPVMPVVNNINDTDNEPPKITILSPNQGTYNISNLNYEILIDDNSNYTVDIYINNNKLTYSKNGNRYTGTINLIENKNIFKITAKDSYNNENTKTIYLDYIIPKQGAPISENKSPISENKSPISENNSTPENNSPISENNSIKKPSTTPNIIYGTVIKKIGNASLIINDETEISTDGDISINKVELPNTTMAYLISPKDAEFSKPLILEIKIDATKDKILRMIYYDEQSKVWTTIPYTYNNDTITAKITKSGYYALKEETAVENNKSPIEQIISIVKIIINVIKHIIGKF
ncbi:hypothetical protein [Methanococcus aeolicus]|uniref:hypothetical protein n=1 Tax=Methanococcus aeolicus TaxID=42879 RepID=UPI0021C7B9F1|nr:hypothetical protein [Methanococcus aeolicus]UXM85411.1 hypothetical protein N6C89_03800 [Methanococcus aeolicus]